MGQYITLFELIIVSAISLIGYAFIKTVIETFKRK